jgi:DNA-binding MarR family transcriptional regulator
VNPNELTSYQAMALLSRSQRRLQTFMSQALKEYELTIAEWNALGLLHDFASKGGLKPTQLANLLDVKPSLVSAHIKSLSQRGFVTQKDHESDGRAQTLAPTRGGEKLIDKVEKQLKIELDKWFGTTDQRHLFGYIKTLQSFASRDV